MNECPFYVFLATGDIIENCTLLQKGHFWPEKGHFRPEGGAGVRTPRTPLDPPIILLFQFN
jgi:hypothetical protein